MHGVGFHALVALASAAQVWRAGGTRPAHLGVVVPQLRDQAPGHALGSLQRRPGGGHVTTGRGSTQCLGTLLTRQANRDLAQGFGTSLDSSRVRRRVPQNI